MTTRVIWYFQFWLINTFDFHFHSLYSVDLILGAAYLALIHAVASLEDISFWLAIVSFDSLFFFWICQHVPICLNLFLVYDAMFCIRVAKVFISLVQMLYTRNPSYMEPTFFSAFQFILCWEVIRKVFIFLWTFPYIFFLKHKF